MKKEGVGGQGVDGLGVPLLGINRWFVLFARTSMVLDSNPFDGPQ